MSMLSNFRDNVKLKIAERKNLRDNPEYRKEYLNRLKQESGAYKTKELELAEIKRLENEKRFRVLNKMKENLNTFKQNVEKRQKSNIKLKKIF